MCSSVDVSAEPHRFVPGRAPPHFTRYAGWVGGDAGLSGVHIAVHLDGIFYTALVWIHPVFPYTRKWLIDSLQSYDNKINQQGSLSHRSKSPCTDNISWFIMFETSHRKKNRKNNHWHTTIYRFPVKKKEKKKRKARIFLTHISCLLYQSLLSLTTLLHGVASLQVVTGPGRMFLAAIRALHAVDLAAEGLQRGLNARVHGHDGGGVAVGHSLVLAELRRRRRARVVILRAAEEVIHGSHGRSWGTRGACGSRLSWRALWIRNSGVF